MLSLWMFNHQRFHFSSRVESPLQTDAGEPFSQTSIDSASVAPRLEPVCSLASAPSRLIFPIVSLVCALKGQCRQTDGWTGACPAGSGSLSKHAVPRPISPHTPQSLATATFNRDSAVASRREN